MSLDPALRARIDGVLVATPVVLFMKGSPQAPQCGFSAKAVAVLSGLGIDYAHVDVLQDAEIREGIKAYGDWPTIPQLYIGGELVGGSDILAQMAASGELQQVLGLPPPDRTPPAIEVTDAAAATLRNAIADAGGDVVVLVEVDPRFRTRLNLAAADPHAIHVAANGIALQVGVADARRAEGLRIDFADDHRGRGLVIENPNAPPPVRELSPADAAARLAAGTLVVVDVRPPEERALAAVAAVTATLDDGGSAVAALPRDTAVAFLCHHGSRSAEAAAQFRDAGFREVYNIVGGIDAWADIDPAVATY